MTPVLRKYYPGLLSAKSDPDVTSCNVALTRPGRMQVHDKMQTCKFCRLSPFDYFDHTTAEFAVASLRRWWKFFGRRHYPNAQALLLCADGGGSNGSWNRAWKYHLQQFADQHGLAITTCHYPPGTSKWNKIEHRMFSFISLNRKGQPLVSYETVVNLIGATRTTKGLKVKAQLDPKMYEAGVKIPDHAMELISLRPHTVYPAWNYTISPRTLRDEK
jgi:Rhodopirellula transposase DDE domain